MKTLTLVVGLAGFLGATALATADLPELVARGTLRVLASADEDASMFNWGDGEPGFERELIEGFARLHKLRVEPVKVDRFEKIIPALLAGEGDVIIGIIDTPERRQQLAFTTETLPARHLVVTRKPHRVVQTLDEFKAEKVGTVQGTSWWRAAVAGGIAESELTPYPDRNELLAALGAGRITATVMSLSDFTLALKKSPDLQGGVFVGDRLSAAWGLRKEDKALKSAFDDYVSNARRTQSWSRLIVKYFGNDALAVLGRASER
jgi:ABC-type amino acid transport substrate-binding protein